jgi:hypothetical protein
MNECDDKELFELFLGQLTDGGLRDDQFVQFGRLIESSSKFRRAYLEHCQIHGLLSAEHGLLASCGTAEADGLLERAGQFSLTQSLKRFVAPFVAIAALLAVSTIGVSYFYVDESTSPLAAPPPYRGDPIAHLRKQVRAQFVYGPNGETTPPAASLMPQGTYELQSGIVELELDSGVSLTIEGPAVFTLADNQCIRIENGRIAAHVPKEATGFRVETASATVVDLGTDFAVEAVSGKNSEVHVFNGEVRVNLHGSKTTSARPLTLTTGEAARIDFVTGMPSGINLDDQRFLRHLESEPRPYTKRVIELQPAVYYPMEPAGDGAFLKDVASFAADAQIHFGHAAESVWAPGKVGLAFSLGGPSQQTYAAAGSYPQAEGNQLTVMAWINARTRPRWASIAKNWAGSEQWGQFHFGLYYDSGELEAHIQDSTGSEVTVRDAAPLPLNEWHHVALVADGSMLRLYRNGREVASSHYRELRRDPRIRALAIGTKLNLAADGPDQRDFNMWDGRLDELAIFNHALSAEQIQELHELGNAGN